MVVILAAVQTSHAADAAHDSAMERSFDLGSDTLTGLKDADNKPPFTFSGKLNKLTIEVNRPKLSPVDIEKLKDSGAKAEDIM